jgi:cyclopropane fatty-acyl-phospholipid synthase-like methyltransferase
MTGVDIQDGLVAAGNAVSGMVGLADKVKLIAGDVTNASVVPAGEFDAFISLLVILHISDRESLFNSLFRSLKDGGCFLIEDMVALETFDTEEDRIARDVIGSPFLPSVDVYRQHLESAGFVDVEFETLTPAWVQWAASRSEQYDASKDEQIKLHGEKMYAQRSSFYGDVKKLFKSGKLGGVRITGRKPSQAELALRRHREHVSRSEKLAPDQQFTIIERD